MPRCASSASAKPRKTAKLVGGGNLSRILDGGMADSEVSAGDLEIDVSLSLPVCRANLAAIRATATRLQLCRRMDAWRCKPRSLVVLGSALPACGSWRSRLVAGRMRLDASSVQQPSSAASERDQLYAELAADVAELEQHGSILKRVVKLVTPTVVHIEARRDNDAARSPRGDAEEAGSGVIIERRGKLYVLTNRHVIKYSTLNGHQHQAGRRPRRASHANLVRPGHRHRHHGDQLPMGWFPPGSAIPASSTSATSCWPSAAPSA